MRVIRFRGKRHYDGKWVYGYPLIVDNEKYKSANIVTFDEVYPDTLAKVTTSVEFNTLGQFTGLIDINGREIYEGDIVEYYSTDTYCINPDCEPHVRGYGFRLCKRIKTVMFDEGIFYADNTFAIVPLAHEGIQVEDIDELKNDPYFDANGYDLDDAVGVEVIGNIHDNPELLGEKGGKK